MTEHVLKTWPAYFDAVERGEKVFEVRRDDRGYQKGDMVILWRYDPHPSPYHMTQSPDRARKVRGTIGWILTGGQFGLEPGYVAFSLLNVEPA